MSTVTVDYVAKRAELLAQLVLTRRKGVQLLSFTVGSHMGIDLIAQLPPLRPSNHDKPIQPYLCVQVRGTSEPLEDEQTATAYAKRYWESEQPSGMFLSPVVSFLFSVDGDKGYFSWAMEPRVDGEEGPSLSRVEVPEMTKITRKSIDAILDEVEKWFDAMSDRFFRDNNAR